MIKYVYGSGIYSNVIRAYFQFTTQEQRKKKKASAVLLAGRISGLQKYWAVPDISFYTLEVYHEKRERAGQSGRAS
jgi:hypothetical protein